jgi:hypothetical protein
MIGNVRNSLEPIPSLPADLASDLSIVMGLWNKLPNQSPSKVSGLTSIGRLSALISLNSPTVRELRCSSALYR